MQIANYSKEVQRNLTREHNARPNWQKDNIDNSNIKEIEEAMTCLYSWKWQTGGNGSSNSLNIQMKIPTAINNKQQSLILSVF